MNFKINKEIKIKLAIFTIILIALFLVNSNHASYTLSEMIKIDTQINYLLEHNNINEDTELNGYNIKILEEYPDENNPAITNQNFEITKGNNIHIWKQKAFHSDGIATIKTVSNISQSNYGFNDDNTFDIIVGIMALSYICFLFSLWKQHFHKHIKISQIVFTGCCFFFINAVLPMFIYPFIYAQNTNAISPSIFKGVNLLICILIVLSNWLMTRHLVTKHIEAINENQ